MVNSKTNDTVLSKAVEAYRPLVEAPRDETKLELLAEELTVAKETRETGRVRIATRTQEREVLIDENLARERFGIETVPVGRQIDAVPDVRQEGDVTIIPVVEEVLVVRRQLMLKEEIRVTRQRTAERYQDKVVLRRQEAVVTRHQNDASKTDARPEGGSGQTKIR